MNDFDQAARRALKEAPAGQVRWLLPNLPEWLRYHRWLDSQSAPRPGEPDRRCDTIAELTDERGTSEPWAAVIELFTAADADAVDRLVEYLGRFRRELRGGPYGHDRYPFAAALLFLTDGPATATWNMTLPGGDSKTLFEPRLVKLNGEDAVVTMDGIKDNRLDVWVGVWVPLMRGGQTREAVQRWRELAPKETNEHKRRTLASLAVIFAQLTDCDDVWRTELEGFGVNESTILREARLEGHKEGLKEGKREGTIEATRGTLLRLLRSRPGNALPTAVEQRIEQETNPDTLSRWFDLALNTATRDAFVAGLDG